MDPAESRTRAADSPSLTTEHGHGLFLELIRSRWSERFGDASVRILEVGTTREPHPGQDSTRAIAEFCLEHGWTFVTVDMDPVNTSRASELFKSMGAPFAAVTSRGEDFIARHRRAFDAAYLDAYDFDHGRHSEARQQRYQEVLGARIDQHESEVMHLEAMASLTRAGRRNCLVVIDDTWLDDGGRWQGKGPLVIPYALHRGWRLIAIDPDRRAVAMQRQSPAAQLRELVRRRVPATG